MNVGGSSNPGWSSQPNATQGSSRDNSLTELGSIQQKQINIDGAPGTYTKNLYQFGTATEIEIYATVQTALSSNITGCYLLLTDGVNEVPLTEAATGADLSSLPQNSWVGRIGDETVALTSLDSSQVRKLETALDRILKRVLATPKSGGGTSYIAFRYTYGGGATASGALAFVVRQTARGQGGPLFPAP